jgi:6-pyruvoyltetrahydropterin/6-carboxytetrahydropterin synthase
VQGRPGTPLPYIPDVPAFQVTVAKESLGFSAAHFLTLPGHVCERLHGHNYRVAVTVDGELIPDTGFVIDFAVLKRAVRGLIEPLDHRVLVPDRNPRLTLRDEPGRLIVGYEGQDRWLVLPRDHACLVPVRNTTAEQLAEWMGCALNSELGKAGAGGIARLTLELEESTGQSATVTIARETP